MYFTSPYIHLFNPPYTPEKYPTGVYVHDFEYSLKDDKTYELVFEGFDSALYVYVNGKFVGFSTVAHNESVFDVTPYLKDGKNGMLFEPQSVEALAEAILKFEKKKFDRKTIASSVDDYSEARFDKEIKTFVKKCIQEKNGKNQE